jgi:hypothetical protein
VQFNSVVKKFEYTPTTPQSDSESANKDSDDDSDAFDSADSDEACGSSDEDQQSGIFIRQIERDRKRAEHERKYLMENLKVK